MDADGSILGHVVSVTSGSGYGGDISLTVGVDLDGSITGVEITESSVGRIVPLPVCWKTG